MTLLGAALAALLGVFAVRPASGASRERWLRAARLNDLAPGKPVPCVLAVPANDGWYRERSREIVFVVWDGAKDVRALSATCTHLGCRVNWDGAAQAFRCPCHGGVFHADGRVLEGPPPRPLDPLQARIVGGDVLVQL